MRLDEKLDGVPIETFASRGIFLFPMVEERSSSFLIFLLSQMQRQHLIILRKKKHLKITPRLQNKQCFIVGDFSKQTGDFPVFVFLLSRRRLISSSFPQAP